MEQQLSILELLDVTSDKEEVNLWFTETDSGWATLWWTNKLVISR